MDPGSEVALTEVVPPPDPVNRLPAAARTLWRLRAAGSTIVAAVITITLASEAGDGWMTAALAFTVFSAVVWVGVAPELRHRRWRYEVREEEIDIRHGTFTITRTIVPMRRVQHVETSRGLLEQALDLATVTFHTAAGSTEIPALEAAAAERVRTQIAQLARTLDDL